jgi:uncharacterized membrane protein
MTNKKSNRLITSLRKNFIAGLLFLVPFTAAILILAWIFSTIDGILQPIIKLIFGHEILGLGLISTIALILIFGIIWNNVLGRSILKGVGKVVERVPIFSQIYTGAKQVMESLGGAQRNAFKEAVLIDFPQAGTKSLAFVTNVMDDENGQKIYTVYVPGSPNPTSGFLMLLRDHQIYRPDLAVDCAMRMIVSCGMVTPEKCRGFGLADGYKAPAGADAAPGVEGAVPIAVPVNLSDIVKPKSSKL